MSGNPNLQVPDEAERAKMSREELAALGMALDGVELAEYGERYIPGSPADKRAERQVAKWFLLAGLMAVLFIVAFIWWPNASAPASSDGQLAYALYTPIIGATLGATILFFGIGVVAMAKKIMPHEVAIQQRHIGMSDQVDRQTLAAQVLDVGDKAGIKRRGMLKGSLLLAGGGLGIAALVPVRSGPIHRCGSRRGRRPPTAPRAGWCRSTAPRSARRTWRPGRWPPCSPRCR